MRCRARFAPHDRHRRAVFLDDICRRDRHLSVLVGGLRSLDPIHPCLPIMYDAVRHLCPNRQMKLLWQTAMDGLKDKRTLITGGTSGIGLETARQFLAEGARVAVTGLNPATIEAARNDLGGGVLVIRSDAGDVAAQADLAEAIRSAFGGLDVLVINAGVVDFRPIEQWDEVSDLTAPSTSI